MINDSPILLLDDVMSELDEKRRDALFGSLEGIQSIITCTGYDDFIRRKIEEKKSEDTEEDHSNRIYHIRQGTITEEKI